MFYILSPDRSEEAFAMKTGCDKYVRGAIKINCDKFNILSCVRWRKKIIKQNMYPSPFATEVLKCSGRTN